MVGGPGVDIDFDQSMYPGCDCVGECCETSCVCIVRYGPNYDKQRRLLKMENNAGILFINCVIPNKGIPSQQKNERRNVMFVAKSWQVCKINEDDGQGCRNHGCMQRVQVTLLPFLFTNSGCSAGTGYECNGCTS